MTELAFDLNGPVKLQVLINSESGYPAGLIADVLKVITGAAFRSEVDDLVQVGKNFPELKLSDVKRSITLLREVKERQYTITIARSGSLILTGVVAGLAI